MNDWLKPPLEDNVFVATVLTAVFGDLYKSKWMSFVTIEIFLGLKLGAKRTSLTFYAGMRAVEV